MPYFEFETNSFDLLLDMLPGRFFKITSVESSMSVHLQYAYEKVGFA